MKSSISQKREQRTCNWIVLCFTLCVSLGNKKGGASRPVVEKSHKWKSCLAVLCGKALNSVYEHIQSSVFLNFHHLDIR